MTRLWTNPFPADGLYAGQQLRALDLLLLISP
jgi:hypothetical protein